MTLVLTDRFAAAALIAALLGVSACQRSENATPPQSAPRNAEQEYVDRCLSVGPGGESTSKLWADLAKFAFALADEDTTAERAEIVLDRAAHAVEGLDSETAWSSAGRYFQAENLHAFEAPACARAYRMRATLPGSP